MRHDHTAARPARAALRPVQTSDADADEGAEMAVLRGMCEEIRMTNRHPAVGYTTCAYCGVRRAVQRDHVIPDSLVKKYDQMAASRKIGRHLYMIPNEWRQLVPACFECNIAKAARRLIPPSWADKIDALNDYFGGTPWRVWTGSVDEPAYREVWV